MSKLHKTIIFVLFVIMAFAALLSPAPRLLSDLARMDKTEPQASQSVAYDFPFLSIPDDGWTVFSYTWAG